MAFTQADLDQLDEAIKESAVVETMTFADGTSFTFRSIEDMQRVRAMMAQQVAGTATRTRFASVSKGV